MSVLVESPATHASESQHWYTRSGEPAYDVIGRNGNRRPTTLRDARELLLVPSVTTIIKCAAAPGLERWKQEQVLLAALTLGRQALEPEADWVARVFRDSQEQGRAAAERGTEIHARIEAWYGDPQLVGADDAAVCEVVERAIDEAFGTDARWYPEQAFAHPLGFGGKCDLLSHPTTVDALIDLKTKDPWQEGTRLAWDEHAIQLAAYRVGVGREQAACANVFVSRTPPWQVHVHRWTEDDLQRGWAMFEALLAYHQAKSGYDGSWERFASEVEFDDIPF